jgi:tetratricopeptide (TPR) repeat protein
MSQQEQTKEPNRPDSVRLSFLRRDLDRWRENDDWQKIVATLHPLAEKFPEYQEDPDLLQEAAFALSQTGHFSEARKYYQKLKELQPDDFHPLANLAYVRYMEALEKKNTQLLRQAAEEYEKVLLKEPSYLIAHFRLGMIFTRLRIYDAARDWFKRVISIYEEMDSEQEKKRLARKVYLTYYNLARGEMEENDPEAAVAYLQKGTESFPQLKEGYYFYQLGKAQLQLRNFEQSLKALQYALELGYKKEFVFNLMAVAQRGLKNYSAALEMNNRALSLKQAAYLYLSRGMTYFRMDNLNAARKDFQAALRNARLEKHKVLLAMGMLALEMNNPEKAREEFLKANSFKKEKWGGDYDDAMFQLGQLELRTGDRKKAEEYLARAEEARPVVTAGGDEFESEWDIYY